MKSRARIAVILSLALVSPILVGVQPASAAVTCEARGYKPFYDAQVDRIAAIGKILCQNVKKSVYVHIKVYRASDDLIGLDDAGPQSQRQSLTVLYDRDCTSATNRRYYSIVTGWYVNQGGGPAISVVPHNSPLSNTLPCSTPVV